MRRPLKTAVFALVPLLLLMVLLELTLWALGLGDPDANLSLSRGFDPRARYLVPVPDEPGAFLTQMFDKGLPEIEIPPKGERRRVVLLGGSNTRSFPERYLQKLLNSVAAAPGYEVVNLGRPGYGSERVVILLRQALELDPDLIFIYSGHNEFVEAGFALELVSKWPNPTIRSLFVGVTSLRSVNVLAGALRSPPKAPEGRRPRSQTFDGMALEQTLTFYDYYEQNLRSMVDATRNAGVPVILSTVIGNDLVAPWVVTDSTEGTAEERERADALAARARALMPDRLTRGLLPPLRLRQEDWGMALTPARLLEREAELADREPRSPPDLRTMQGPLASTPVTEGRQMASVEGAHWADPALWMEPVFAVLNTVDRIQDGRLTDDDRAALEQAADLYEQSLDVLRDQPNTLFALGLCHYALGDGGSAAALLQEAIDRDRAPRRGNRHTNGIVRAVAADLDVRLLDAEALFRQRMPDGIVGYEVMTDVCHMQPGAKAVLMADFAEIILREFGDIR